MNRQPTSATVAGIRQVAAVRAGARAANDEHGGAPIQAGDALAGSGPDAPTSARTAAAGQTTLPLTGNAAAGITAIVVTYNPDIDRLTELLRLTRPQVAHIEVIDNGSRPETIAAIRALCEVGTQLHPQGRNLGIGGAQNVGIGIARARGSAHVLLLDHDSLPAPDMVARLRAAIESQTAAGLPVAAAGPRYLDPRQPDARSPFVRQQGMKRIYCECRHEDELIEVEHLIASGCLIPMAVLDRVGDMNEQLFIDYVDIEWCLRASHAGFRILGVCGARLSHELGDDVIRFRGKTLPNHSPLRNYYLFRNGLLLNRMPHITPAWKRMDLRNLLIRFIINAVAQRPRWPWVRMSLLGILDGLRGRTGPRQTG